MAVFPQGRTELLLVVSSLWKAAPLCTGCCRMVVWLSQQGWLIWVEIPSFVVCLAKEAGHMSL